MIAIPTPLLDFVRDMERNNLPPFRPSSCARLLGLACDLRQAALAEDAKAVALHLRTTRLERLWRVEDWLTVRTNRARHPRIAKWLHRATGRYRLEESAMSVTIETALRDKQLLGAALGDLATWSTWRAVLKAAFGDALTREELRAFASVAGSRRPPAHKVRELWVLAGRGGGKSRMSAAVAVFIACFFEHDLDAGEVGYVVALAASKDQARRVFDYSYAFLRRSPILRQMIARMTSVEIELNNGVVISTHASSFRSIRGRALLAVVCDEIAYWRDETSANPDIETYRAVKPSLVRCSGVLICISTPYRKSGLLYNKYRDHYDTDDDDVLVVQGSSITFNPTLDQAEIAKELLKDPEAARAEWEAEFRSDIAALLDEAVIEDSIDYSRPLELPPRGRLRYHGFVDSSAGRHDAFALAIGHLEGDKGSEVFVCDVIRGRLAPFDPRSVAQEYASLARSYGCTRITGDAFAGEWVASAFGDCGLRYETSPLNKSSLYLEALPAFNQGMVRIPNYDRLLRELRGLERRTHRSGRDSVDHPAHGGSDDHANALCGSAYIAFHDARKPKTHVGTIGPTGRVRWRDEVDLPRFRVIRISEAEALRQKADGTW